MPVSTHPSPLAQGPGPIIASRLGGLLSAIGNFAVIVCSVVLVPFLLVGAWVRRRSIEFGPWFLYAITPTVAFGVATAEPNGATRWRFDT